MVTVRVGTIGDLIQRHGNEYLHVAEISSKVSQRLLLVRTTYPEDERQPLKMAVVIHTLSSEVAK